MILNSFNFHGKIFFLLIKHSDLWFEFINQIILDFINSKTNLKSSWWEIGYITLTLSISWENMMMGFHHLPSIREFWVSSDG